jgi:ATP-dependent helicase/nuclease subunit B
MGRGTELPVEMRELLRRGGIILTANARAARSLHRRYAKAVQVEGAVAWPVPQILDLHSWLTGQWNCLLLTGTEDRLLLNNLQEHTAWERIIGPAIRNFSLVEPSRMAELAQEAYGLLASYRSLGRLHRTPLTAEPHAEPEAFRQWARSFQQECERRRWLPHCELVDAITYAFQWGALSPPKEIGWIGFDRETPAERALRAALEARGAAQHDLTWKIEPRTAPVLYRAQNEHYENVACAEWARARLASDPEARIGILMPDLASRRPQLERDLYRILDPECLPITAGMVPALRFEFSLGQPLAEAPLVHAALLLLRWLHAPLTQQDLSWLLLSSTLDAAREGGGRDAMAQFDARLRNRRCAPPEISLESFLRESQSGILAISRLNRDLGAMLQQYRRNSQRTSIGEWLRRIARWLHSARWDAWSDASSLVFQAREAWERMLEQIASLDFAAATLPYTDFLAILERTAQKTIFAAESQDSPVQVMGAYAASGQSFDAVWFLGATDTGWPTADRPNPLLPLALQRELGMPHASAADNAALAHRVMARIAESSDEVVYSCAQISGESIQQPSSMVRNFTLATIPVALETARMITLDPVADDTWVPLPATTAAAGGGQMPLKRQAECPFQAFVFHRLNANELPIAGRGLSPADRGTLIHKVMERIWSKDIGDYQHLTGHEDLLHAMSTGTLRPLVARHTAAAVRELDIAYEDPWQRAYLKAEEDRTIELVIDWLELESKRQPFHVAEVEERGTIFVGDLALKIRADRIDHVADGRLLIDYKTGEVSTTSWDGARPEQPQLPLYAAFGHADNLVGAVFAQVRRPKLALKGRVTDPRANLSDKLDPKRVMLTEPYTPELVEQWRSTLLSLSESFVRGEAQVDPHIYPKSCQYCPLSGTCRVVELRGAAIIPDMTDEEDTE